MTVTFLIQKRIRDNGRWLDWQTLTLAALIWTLAATALVGTVVYALDTHAAQRGRTQNVTDVRQTPSITTQESCSR